MINRKYHCRTCGRCVCHVCLNAGSTIRDKPCPDVKKQCVWCLHKSGDYNTMRNIDMVYIDKRYPKNSKEGRAVRERLGLSAGPGGLHTGGLKKNESVRNYNIRKNKIAKSINYTRRNRGKRSSKRGGKRGGKRSGKRGGKTRRKRN